LRQRDRTARAANETPNRKKLISRTPGDLVAGLSEAEKSVAGTRARARVPKMDAITRRSSCSCVDFAAHHASTGT